MARPAQSRAVAPASRRDAGSHMWARPTTSRRLPALLLLLVLSVALPAVGGMDEPSKPYKQPGPGARRELKEVS